MAIGKDVRWTQTHFIQNPGKLMKMSLKLAEFLYNAFSHLWDTTFHNLFQGDRKHIVLFHIVIGCSIGYMVNCHLSHIVKLEFSTFRLDMNLYHQCPAGHFLEDLH